MAVHSSGPIGIPHDSPDAGNPQKVGGAASTATPALVANNDRVNHYHDLAGRGIVNQDLLNAGEDLANNVQAVVTEPLSVQQHSWDRAVANAAVSLVVKASAGRLRKINGTNDNNAARYIMVFNATALPGNGTAPIWVASADGNDVAEMDFTEIGEYFDTGITIAWSSTIHTLTVAVAAGDHNLVALFR